VDGAVRIAICQEEPVKKLLIACALSSAVVAPAAASAADPAPSDVKNAAKHCKQLREASGSNFASMFGTRKNAYGKCVSQTARRQANEDARQEKAAKSNAAQECRAEREESGAEAFAELYGTGKNGRNAFGKCVSSKAKQQQEQADDEDAAEQEDRVNAAKTCKQARNDDPEQFEEDYGTRRNAFGKCVSRTAKQLAEERKAEEPAAA
jgi:hypothetical protein